MFKGNGASSDDYIICLFNGSTFIDQEIQYLTCGGNLQQTLRFKTVLPSSGNVAQTFNFRVGSNSGNAWRQGQINNSATSFQNPYMRSWISIREMLAAP